MNCTEVEGAWIARAEGGLEPGAEQTLQEHLKSCSRCCRLLGQLDLLEHHLEGLWDEPVEEPAFLRTRILASIEERRHHHVLRWFRNVITSRRVLALSVACLAFFAGLLAREVHRVNEWVRGSGIQTVVLEYNAPDAERVRLVGDFNDWGGQGAPTAVRRDDGSWSFQVRLEPGRYQYAFEIDGKKWLPDPNAPGIIPDGFGGANSLLYVGQASGVASRSL